MDFFFFFFLAFYTAKKPSGEKELKLTICWFQSEDNKGAGGGCTAATAIPKTRSERCTGNQTGRGKKG